MCRTYPNGSKKRKKAIEENMREEDVAAKSRIIQVTVTDLNQRNDESRSSLTSSAISKVRQDVSSKNTIDEMADAITVGNKIGLWALWPANIPEKVGVLVEI